MISDRPNDMSRGRRWDFFSGGRSQQTWNGARPHQGIQSIDSSPVKVEWKESTISKVFRSFPLPRKKKPRPTRDGR